MLLAWLVCNSAVGAMQQGKAPLSHCGLHPDCSSQENPRLWVLWVLSGLSADPGKGLVVGFQSSVVSSCSLPGPRHLQASSTASVSQWILTTYQADWGAGATHDASAAVIVCPL